MIEQRKSIPFWLIGVLVALVLILIGQRYSGESANTVLEDQFRAQPAGTSAAPPDFSLPQVNLPQLPPDAQKVVTGLRDRFASGAAVPALTPIASGVRVRVEVQEFKRQGGDAKVRGVLTNIADKPITVPAGAFTFRDSAGIAYTLGGDGTTVVEPGKTTTFDLSVPLPPERGLTLIFTLAPDPPIQQTLIVATTGG